MSDIFIGNAPCSWGTLEFTGLEGERIRYQQMLDELRDTGYTGTELGDWGFMPTEPDALRRELHQRALTLTGAFVPVALSDAAAHAEGLARALSTARLLAAAGAAAPRPFLVLADDNGRRPERVQHAGQVTAELGLSAAVWATFADGVERIARAVRDETGLRTVFHHHCAGYVETPDEIARLLELTDPALVGLVFDTGHFLFGSGQTDPAVVLDGFRRFGDRIWYVHFKDHAPDVAAQARRERWDYFTSLQHGVFCELGQGNVDFRSVTEWLQQHGYHGFITVEQDVLPGMGEPRISAARNRTYLRTLGL